MRQAGAKRKSGRSDSGHRSQKASKRHDTSRWGRPDVAKKKRATKIDPVLSESAKLFDLSSSSLVRAARMGEKLFCCCRASCLLVAYLGEGRRRRERERSKEDAGEGGMNTIVVRPGGMRKVARVMHKHAAGCS